MNQLAFQLEEHLSTQCADVLSCLHLRGYIDPKIAMNDYAIYRLAARVNELKAKGYNIQSEMVPFTSKYGRRGVFARYTLCQ